MLGVLSSGRSNARIVRLLAVVIAVSLLAVMLPVSVTQDVGARPSGPTSSASLSASGSALGSSTIVSPDGWAWQNPLPQGNALYGVWGSSATNVYAVGDLGTILHYDGSNWSAMVNDNTNALFGVWGTSGNDVFAVGQQGIILHYNGMAWQPMSSGLSSSYTLYDVWGTSPSNVFAVGSYGAILHYDGTAWSSMNSGIASDIRGIWGTSPTDVFAAVEDTMVLHYNGSAWSSMETGIPITSECVWGSSSSNVYAGLKHYDGSTWSRLEYYPTGGFKDIWGNSAANVFAVGEYGSIHRYNGSAWSTMSSGINSDLLSVWGSSSSDVFAVGVSGAILHYNGTTWSAMCSSNAEGLNGVWGSSPTDVFAVGYSSNYYSSNGCILHYNGTAWSKVSSGTTSPLNGVWGSSSSDVFAVGSLGTILHYNGTSWSTMSTDLSYPYDLYAVWGSSASDVFAVGNGKTILHYDGDSWSTMTSDSGGNLRAVWGSSSHDVFAMGGGYVDYMFHYNGSTWEAMESGPPSWVEAIWGTSPTNVYAVCDYPSNNSVFHFDGTSWSATVSNVSTDLYGIWGSSSTDIFVAGGEWDGAVYQSMILHWDGADWTTMDTRAASVLCGVWGSSASDVFAAGLGGAILHYPTNQVPSQPENLLPATGTPGISLTPTLQSSAFSDPDDGDTHAASQWQLTTTAGNYSTPTFDSGIDTSNLASVAVPSGELDVSTSYYWHVRYQDSHGGWSSWSAETSFTTINQPPHQPTNVAPANGITGVTLTPTLQSSAFSDLNGDAHAASQWQIGTIAGDYSSPVFDSQRDSTNLVSIAVPAGKLTHLTAYHWHVRHQDVHGDWSSWSAETSFTTINQPPHQPTNVAPASGATGVSLTPTLQSSAFSDPDGDAHAASQWQIASIAGDYSSPASDSLTDNTNLASIAVPAGKLSYSTTYYWHVRHQDNHGDWSGWSAETSFTTTNQAPCQPTNAAPASGATGVSLTPTLQSSAFSDPDSGDTHIASQWRMTTAAGEYLNPVFDSGIDAINLTQISVASGKLNGNTAYYWQVRYQDSHGDWSEWSAETSFTTQNRLPNQPVNTSPAGSSAATSVMPTMQCSVFSDPDSGDSHSASQWQITATAGNYISPVFDSGTDNVNLTQIAVPSGKLNGNTTYYWWVRHQDSHGGWSAWSAETSFNTQNQAPNKPAAAYVTIPAEIVTLTPILQCSPFSDPDAGDTHAASQWRITATAGDYSSPVFDSGTDNADLLYIPIPPGVLESRTTYYWQVRHQDNRGDCSQWSTEYSFTTKGTKESRTWIWIVIGAGAAAVFAAGGAATWLVLRGRKGKLTPTRF